MKKKTLWWYDFLVKIHATKCLKASFSDYLDYQEQMLLFKAKHAAKIIELYSEKRPMSTAPLMKVFELPNAEKILENQIKQARLSNQIEAKLLQHPELVNLAKTYLKSKYSLSIDAQEVLITLPNFEELVAVYLSSENFPLLTKTVLKLFECKESAKLLKRYCSTYRLDPEDEIKLAEHPDFEEIYKSYKFCLRDESLDHLFDRPNADKLILQCVKDGDCLSVKSEAKLFKFENAGEIISEYIKNTALFDENEPLLLTLPNSFDVVKRYMESFYASASFIDAIFASDKAETLLPLVIETQKLSPQQEIKLLKNPNTTQLLLSYIEHNILSVETELELLKMPKKDVEPILREYAKKHRFSHEFLQCLAVDNHLGHLLEDTNQ